jgi:hypothetical protein
VGRGSHAARGADRHERVRDPAYLLRAELGDPNALDAAAILVAEVENPARRGCIEDLRAAAAA